MPATEHPNSIITRVFWLAGAYNIVGVLFFSKLLTNTLLTSLDPAVFSWLGLVGIMVWGLAYASVAKTYQFVPRTVLVFFCVKMIYTGTWLKWLLEYGQTLPPLYSESPLTAIFYSIYGGGDFIFGLFFLWVAVKAIPNGKLLHPAPN